MCRHVALMPALTVTSALYFFNKTIYLNAAYSIIVGNPAIFKSWQLTTDSYLGHNI